MLEKLKKVNIKNVDKVVNQVRRKVNVYYPVTSSSLPAPIYQYKERIEVQAGDTLSVLINSRSDSTAKNTALIALKFRDSKDAIISEVSEFEWSDTVGRYFYLNGNQNGTEVTRKTFKVPDGAESLELKGVRWEKGANTKLRGVAIYSKKRKELVLASGTASSLSPSSDIEIVIPLQEHQKAIKLNIDYMPGDIKSEAPLKIVFLSSDGTTVPTMGDHPIHPKFGPIITLPGSSEPVVNKEWELEVPAGATSLQLEGIDWGEKNALILGVHDDKSTADVQNVIHEFISQALSNGNPIMIIDTTAPPLGHQTLSLRPNNLTDSYARRGINVLFFPFSTIQDQPSVVQENVIQLNRSEYWAAIRALSKLDTEQERIYICSSYPNAEAVAAAEFLKIKGWNIVYECRDDMEEFNRVGYSKWYRPALERKMLYLADVVVSVSDGLDEKLNSLAPGLYSTYIIPNGVNRTVIADGKPLRSLNQTKARNQSTTLGYVGHLTPSWFDWDLLRNAAMKTPAVIYQIVGHGAPENLELPDNVQLMGPKSHKELLDIVGEWKAGIIPFKNVPLTRSVDPNKIYEYFAWGFRCISAPMGKVENYPSTWVYRNVNEFVDAVAEVVERPYTEDELVVLETFLKKCTWDYRAEQMLELMLEQGGSNE